MNMKSLFTKFRLARTPLLLLIEHTFNSWEVMVEFRGWREELYSQMLAFHPRNIDVGRGQQTENVLSKLLYIACLEQRMHYLT